jgi:hypothetical protein
MSDRRVGDVRTALIKAGVPAYKIWSGSYADVIRRAKVTP